MGTKKEIRYFLVTIDPDRYWDGGKAALSNIRACATKTKEVFGEESISMAARQEQEGTFENYPI